MNMTECMNSLPCLLSFDTSLSLCPRLLLQHPVIFPQRLPSAPSLSQSSVLFNFSPSVCPSPFISYCFTLCTPPNPASAAHFYWVGGCGVCVGGNGKRKKKQLVLLKASRRGVAERSRGKLDKKMLSANVFL